MRLFGRVRVVVCWLSLLLLAATLGLWAATAPALSHAADRDASRATLVLERYRAYAVVSHDGVLRLSVTTRLRSDRATGEERPTPISPTWRVRTSEGAGDTFLLRLVLGEYDGRRFGAARDLHGLTSGWPGGSPDFDWTRPRTSAVMFPHWVPAAVFALAPGAWVLRRITRGLVGRRRARAGRCRACGYDLRASTGQCPECGQQAAARARQAAV